MKLWKHSWAVDSNVAQLLIVSELTIAEGSAQKVQWPSKMLPSLLNVQLVKFVTVARRIDPTTAERHYHATICDHCAKAFVEENFADAVAEGFEAK